MKNAEAAVGLWWQRRLYLRKNRVPPKGADPKPVPDVPPEYLRPMGGGKSSRPDGVTAWGVETERSGRSRFPSGVWSTLDVVQRDEAESMRELEAVKWETLEFTERAIIRLGLIDSRYWIAIEMWAAGYSETNIAATFKVERYVAKRWVECALTWVAGCLIIKPDFSLTKAPRVRMQRGDLYAGAKAPRICTAADIGIQVAGEGIDESQGTS